MKIYIGGQSIAINEMSTVALIVLLLHDASFGKNLCSAPEGHIKITEHRLCIFKYCINCLKIYQCWILEQLRFLIITCQNVCMVIRICMHAATQKVHCAVVMSAAHNATNVLSHCQECQGNAVTSM